MNDANIPEDGRQAQRNVFVSNFVSLDGYYAGPDDGIDWFQWNDETEQYSKDQIETIDTILFGRVTYELMESYWPTPASAEEDPAITDAMNNLEKVVFSKTLETANWNNSRLVHGDLEDEVLALKRQPGEDIAIFGSGQIVQELANLGLIDEYRLFVGPTVLGSGKRLFENVEERLDLELVDSRTFSNGVVLLDYRMTEREQ